VQQWKWLENELSLSEVSKYDLILLGTAIQFISDDKLIEEAWNEFPLQRQRLLTLVAKVSMITNIFVLTGDIHSAEMSQMTCSTSFHDSSASSSPSPSPFPTLSSTASSIFSSFPKDFRVMEFTSSGLSHTFSKIIDTTKMKLMRIAAEEAVRLAVPSLSSDNITSNHIPNTSEARSHLIITKSRSLFIDFAAFLYHLIYPGIYRENKEFDVYHGIHFGMIDILEKQPHSREQDNEENKGNTGLTLLFQIISHEGRSVMMKEIPLKPRHPFFTSSDSPSTNSNHKEAVLQELESLLSPSSSFSSSFSGSASNASSFFTCQPIQGRLTSVKYQVFKANIVIFSMIFLIIPFFTVLWFVFAALYYIFIEKELQRRDEIERNYRAAVSRGVVRGGEPGSVTATGEGGIENLRITRNDNLTSEEINTDNRRSHNSSIIGRKSLQQKKQE
jgi:hypothetical protein